MCVLLTVPTNVQHTVFGIHHVSDRGRSLPVYLLPVLPIYRYLCICHPYLRVLTVYRAKIVLVVIGLSTSVIGVFLALIYGVHLSLPTIDISNNDYRIPPNYDLERSSTPDVRVHHGSDVQIDGFSMTPKSSVYSDVGDGDGVNVGDLAILLQKSVLKPPSLATLHAFRATTGEQQGTLYSLQELNGSPDVGICHPNYILLSTESMQNFYIFYNCMCLACLLSVIVLYVLIYRSALALKKRRRRRKCMTLTSPPLVATVFTTRSCMPAGLTGAAEGSRGDGNDICTEGGEEEEEEAEGEGLSPMNETGNESDRGVATGVDDIESTPEQATDVVERRNRVRVCRLWHQLKTKTDKYRQANLKAASMLFVVTVMFVATYVPAFLMTVELLPYWAIVYYMYFINNVANPFIYSFMNQRFRDAMRPAQICASRSTAAVVGRPAAADAADEAAVGSTSKRSE